MPFQPKFDATTLPTLIFGSVLILTAVVAGIFVWRARRYIDPSDVSDDDSRLYADRQFRRRTQVCAMLGLIGILIIVGDQMDQVLGQRPILFVLWVLSVLVLVVWMVLLALGDSLSTFAYTAAARSKLKHERSELEEEIRRYRASKARGSIDEEDDLY